MTGTKKLIDQIEITLQDDSTGNRIPVWVDVHDNSLSRRWLTALNYLLDNNYHLEKNYCWLGWTESRRNAKYLCEQINLTFAAINAAGIGYEIQDHFTVENTIDPKNDGINHDKFNQLHRYFEDLQGISGQISPFYTAASDQIKWHIRQLNLLCHEYESLILSMRKAITAPMWRRPSQLMCWLNSPRFTLESEDYELFGIETINRPLGGVFIGVNKAVGKHHFEVYMDEGRDSRIGELTTTTLKSQTEAAGDFDIEWANNPGAFHWQIYHLAEFRKWLIANGFDPEDKMLTIGHPQIGQVDLQRTFGTEDYVKIWKVLGQHLNVVAIKTGQSRCEYNYNWTDSDYAEQQIARIAKGN